jgi:excisionase family DNA binding protein
MKATDDHTGVRGELSYCRQQLPRTVLKSSTSHRERPSFNGSESRSRTPTISSGAAVTDSFRAEAEAGARAGNRTEANPADADGRRIPQLGVERPLTCNEASEIVRAHPKTVKRMARSGKLPGHFRFGRWFFYASELDDWMRTELHSSSHSCR